MFGKGGYGNVRTSVRSGRVTKTTRALEGKQLVANNFIELGIATYLKKLEGTNYRPRNFIRIDSVGILGSKILIEMEQGKMSLHDFIKNTPFMERMAKFSNIIKQLIEGLYDLHKHNLVHCDFKPDNVIVMDDGTVRIIDFGSVRLIGSPANVMCTYVYSAPEALSEDSKPAPAVDAWSLGALM